MRKIRLGLVLLVSLLLFAVLFQGKGTIDTSLRVALPSALHPFGCDSLGRDLLSRVSYGILVSLAISVTSALLSVLVGTVLAAFLSFDHLVGTLSRSLCDAFKVLPPVVLALFLVSFGGNGAWKVILAISLSGGANVARTLSSRIKVIRSEEYVLAAEASGIPPLRIWRRHILPMVYPYLREHAASVAVSGILTESSLSYLGLGVKKTTPTLGAVLSEGRSLILSSPHVTLFPALMLLLLGVSLLLLSRGFSELDSASHR
ncbi:MAG: ABC transporter permease [Spirochaetales bacterium]|nr:ABC transporter permease [Candidatus Physcosoma equi]